MIYLKKLITAFVPMLLLLSGIAYADEMRDVKGVVVSSSAINQTITVRDDVTQTRNTYFVGASTELSSRDGQINFDDIKKGQAVTLKFSRSRQHAA